MDDLERFLASEPQPEEPPRRRRPLGWVFPALGLLLSGALLGQQWPDVEYLFSSPAPLDLGAPGDYHLERARAGAFARIAGRLSPEGSHYTRGLFHRELVPFLDAPVLLDRPEPAAGNTPVQGAPSVAEGRLEPESADRRFDAVIRYFLTRDELAPPGRHAGTAHVWILTEGQRPWHLGASAAWLAWLLALVLFNVGWLWRRLAR